MSFKHDLIRRLGRLCAEVALCVNYTVPKDDTLHISSHSLQKSQLQLTSKYFNNLFLSLYQLIYLIRMAYPRSILPLLLRSRDDWWDHPALDRWSSGGWEAPNSRLFDQHFGQSLGNTWEDSLSDLIPAVPSRTLARQYSRSMSQRPRGPGVSEVTNDANQFQVKLDVAHFGPSEITVKAIEGNTIVIEGRHEEKQDEHGYISRQFTRRYVLPRDVITEQITSSLTPEGNGVDLQ